MTQYGLDNSYIPSIGILTSSVQRMPPTLTHSTAIFFQPLGSQQSHLQCNLQADLQVIRLVIFFPNAIINPLNLDIIIFFTVFLIILVRRSYSCSPHGDMLSSPFKGTSHSASNAQLITLLLFILIVRLIISLLCDIIF